MGLLRLYAIQERAELKEQGVGVHVLGNVEALDDSTRAAVDEIVRETACGLNLRLNIMISYSGRDEILHACRGMAARVAAGIWIHEISMRRPFAMASSPGGFPIRIF